MEILKKQRGFPLYRLAMALSFVCVFFLKINGQPPFQLRIEPLDQDSFFVEKRMQYQTEFTDTALIFKELEKAIAQLQNQAYLEASFDSLNWSDSVLVAKLHTGEPYDWAWLENGNVDEVFLARSGFKGRLYQGRPVGGGELQKIRERLLEQAENNGFPFARVWLDSLEFSQKGTERHLGARIFMDKGPLVFFDSLNVKGEVKISKNYLRKYLGIKQGEVYSRKKILKTKDRLRDLPFLKEKNSATVSFRDDQASVQLYLEKKKNSRFDFLLGVLPDNGRPDQKLILTGTFNAEFQNQFGLGERILVAFDRLRPQTQRMEAAFAYPYILDLPFGADLKFNQYRRDSAYTDIVGEVGLQYLFQGGNFLKVFRNSSASNLISVDTTAIRQGRFPSHLDVKSNAFGLEASWLQLDYRFNPRQGWSVLLNGSAGIRQIRRNQAILRVAESFYDTLPGRSFRFVLNGEIERYFPLFQRSAIKVSAHGGAVVSQEPVYQNEQFRLGGNQLMRGFDEESIFATFFTVFTLEYRLLTGQNSWFFLFGDYGYVEDRRYNTPARYDRPLGFGGGMTFETTAGMFSIGLAVGKRESSPPDFRNPKVHFGYVSIF